MCLAVHRFTYGSAFVCTIFALAVVANAELVTIPAANADAFPNEMPHSLLECEGSAPCSGYWTFNGSTGTAEWPAEATTADLTGQRFDQDQITITRTDTSKPDFTAVYTGTLSRGVIKGNVTWSWPSHWSAPVHGAWRAIVQDTPFVQSAYKIYSDPQQVRLQAVAAAAPPLISGSQVLSTPTFFDLNGVWQNSLLRSDGSASVPIRIRQDGQHVQMTQNLHAAMMRNSPRDAGDIVEFDGTYHGTQIVGRGRAGAVTGPPLWLKDAVTVQGPDQLLVGTVVFKRLSSVGRHDAVCDLARPEYIDIASAKARETSSALKYHQYAKSACWSRIAADEGDARSATVLAIMYHNGTGLPKNPAKAFYWAGIGSSRGDSLATNILADMYEHGIGTPVDHKQAQAALTLAQSQQSQQSQQAPSNLVGPSLGSLMFLGAMALMGQVMSTPTCYRTERDMHTNQTFQVEDAGGSDCQDF